MKVTYADFNARTVIVTFDDGSSFLYSAELLYEMSSKAEPSTSIPPPDESEDG